MNPDSFWNSPIREVLLMIDAFTDKEIEAWKRTRFQSYILYCSVTDENKRKSIYEFLSLENDTTPEELVEIEKKEAKAQIDDAVAIYNAAKDYL